MAKFIRFSVDGLLLGVVDGVGQPGERSAFVGRRRILVSDLGGLAAALAGLGNHIGHLVLDLFVIRPRGLCWRRWRLIGCRTLLVGDQGRRLARFSTRIIGVSFGAVEEIDLVADSFAENLPALS